MHISRKIRKAVFPVAGLGTRFLPATKASPKEMLPIVDKPIIQFAVEEAIAAGIRELIFITSGTKRSIEDHFDSNFELEMKLREKNNKEMLHLVQNILPKNVSCVYVRQPEALGLGHAVLCAKDLIGNEPFAVILADDLIDSGTSCLSQMCNLFEATGGSFVAVQPVEDDEVHRYGIVDLMKDLDPYAQLKGIVEKPALQDAPSRHGVVGRYILTPQILDILATTARGAGGEIQLTDAISQLLRLEKVFAYAFDGVRYDCGSKLGYLEATIVFALKHPDLAKPFQEILDRYQAGKL
ncbi:MAG: UTP--glucose-1-phosphate uridylyltransferase GalU [Gammaproteobacteria bacterium]|nr:UTP--glucose-1-phosphate uridylyltransferase GalU [Gammaproteobacteria bacterium]